MTDAPLNTRCGVVALVGAPNAGKSTLLNRLTGQKLAIVSPKPQTTRALMRGIVMEGDSQIIFVDTPGLFYPKKTLEKAMVSAALAGANDADLIVYIADTSSPDKAAAILENLKQAKPTSPVWLLLNKVDASNKATLLPVAEKLAGLYDFQKTFMVSALTGDGVDDFRQKLAEVVPEGPWLYDPEQVTDMPQRVMAAEITREQLYLQLEEELPYAATVETESWENFDNGTAKVSQIIYVARDGQKGIVIGKQGSRLKAIGEAARKEMKEAFGFQVHLFLHVKVKENWQEMREFYESRGLDFRK